MHNTNPFASFNRYKEYLEAREKMREKMPDNPASFGWKTFSQNDEDGIIRECLNRISKRDPLSHTFIEAACGNGIENNTYQLILDGFRGVWLDGSEKNIHYIMSVIGNIKQDKLKIYRDFLNIENLPIFLKECMIFIGEEKNLDIFSLDLDGNDLYFSKIIAEMLQPKLLVCEYNATFPPPIDISIAYNPTHIWTGDNYQGASLQAFSNILTDYMLVSCNLTGTNAFFVHNKYKDLFTNYSIYELYQETKWWYAIFPSGHPPTLKWLADTLKSEV